MFTLVRAETSEEDAINDRHQWPVQFTATYSEDDTEAKVFVMQAAADDLATDSLSCVASAIQMVDLPEDAPTEDGPFYRVSIVTKLCRSADAAKEFAEKVKDAVQDLANNIQASETLSEVETVTITPAT